MPGRFVLSTTVRPAFILREIYLGGAGALGIGGGRGASSI